VTSLVGFIVVLGVLLLFYRYSAFNAIREHESRNNVALTRVFANTLWPRHAAFIANAAALPKAQLRARPEQAALRRDVLDQMEGLNVVKVKIYDLTGTTVFSTDPKQIGEDKSANSGFLAAKAGRTASEVTFRNSFDAFEQVINDRNLVSSYVPVRSGDGRQVEAVMEVYSDVTDFVEQLERTQWQIVAAVLGSLALLYLFLLGISRRADRILTEQREATRIAHHAMLQHQASHDALTELPNRKSFAERLALMIKAARRAGTQVAVLCIRVHGVRAVNESLGPHAGDRLLKAVAERVTSCLREADITGRRGGAEFAAAVSGARSIEHVVGVVETIRDSVAGSTYAVDEHQLAVTVDIGIALHPYDGVDAEQLITSADAAMHHAAASGRNAYQFHTADMNTRAVAMLSTEQGLRRALERNEFLLHYQPQLDLRTSHIIGVEALIRWQHPERGLVSPAAFIPVAEERDLIVPIGQWVLREACRQARAWQDAGLPPVSVAVNLSALQFQQKDLPLAVARVLEETRLDARYLELELTESAVMRDAERSLGALRALHEVGVRLSLDDFGTGYSSLGQLKRLPLDKLKIDRSFVADLPHDRYDLAISNGIVGIGKALNLAVVAEGVETAEQLRALRAAGCSGIQGYLVAKPLPAADYAEFARSPHELPA
jgi:diguanylate cyclase (GGDEF)-like protein